MGCNWIALLIEKSCYKQFTQLIALNLHQKRVHEGQKDYICEFCEKHFFAKIHQDLHIKRAHEGQKVHRKSIDVDQDGKKDQKCENKLHPNAESWSWFQSIIFFISYTRIDTKNS